MISFSFLLNIKILPVVYGVNYSSDHIVYQSLEPSKEINHYIRQLILQKVQYANSKTRRRKKIGK